MCCFSSSVPSYQTVEKTNSESYTPPGAHSLAQIKSRQRDKKKMESFKGDIKN